MCRNTPVALVTAILLASAWPAHATCTANHPGNNVVEATPTSAFVDHGNGTVTHNLTGLMWKQCAEGFSGSGCAYGSPSSMTWAAALASAKATNTASFAGYNDWRLPNTKELESIVELCGHGPAINNTVFPKTYNSFFWSASSFIPDLSAAWYVDFDLGYANASSKENKFDVRLVRAGQAFDSFDGVAMNNQAIAFGSAPSIVAGGKGTLSATASSGLPVSFSSTTSNICTVFGNTVTGVIAGTCTIAANQSGNSSYNPAPQVLQSFSIASSAPNPPSILSITLGSGSATLYFSPPSNNGGSPITRYVLSCTANGQITRTASGTVSPIIVKGLKAKVTYQCALTATNAGGLTSASSAPVSVTPTRGVNDMTPQLMLLD